MKKVLISFFIIGIIVSLGIIGNKYFNKEENLNSDKTLISYYVETGEGTGIYEKQDGTTWPEGYVLNEEKSNCDNGSTLSWDYNNNSVLVTATKEDSCKVYMDKKVLIYFTLPNAYGSKVQLTAEKGMTWQDWISSNYSNDYDYYVYCSGDGDVSVNLGTSYVYYVTTLGTVESKVLDTDEIIENYDYVFYVYENTMD